ncbi:MAG TPA: cache domain-containing protein [Candidatus Nitrosocosmicus sp.]|nr:cache domain-containing protein [Candidatus Nitrosocosmicus sp.]
MKPSKANSTILLILPFVASILVLNVASTEQFADVFGKTNELNNLGHKPNLDKIFALEIFANVVQDRINSIINLLEFASNDQVLSTLPYLNNISETNHGIPLSLDHSKRQAINDILKINPDIASIYLALPNGDIYLGEPYSHQEQLPRLNFADREWYIGVTTTNSTYVSSVFLSASINAPAIAIAVPVLPANYSDNVIQTLGKEPLAYLVGIVNLQPIKETIGKIDINATGRFLVIDRNGTVLIDPIDSPTKTLINKFDYFDKLDFKKTQLGPLANHTFIYDHNNTTVFYRPISFEGVELIAVLVAKNY